MTRYIVKIADTSALVVFALLQTAPQHMAMSGGGDLSISREADTLRLAVAVTRPGLAHLCVAENSRVRILHASAAIGEAVYEQGSGGWKLTSGFEFKLRDRRDAPPTDAERQSFFKTMGWLANADNSGKATREFSLRVTPGMRLAVAFLATDATMAVSHWPATVADDCIATKMVQGFLPPQARFDPSTWNRVQ